MITPVNGHLLIEPLPQESFIASDRETYQEIGVVIDADAELLGSTISGTMIKPYQVNQKVSKGDKVYFDSWLAAKFPKDAESFYWLVEWSNVRAVEYAQQEIPE